jgi:hypothetical protein
MRSTYLRQSCICKIPRTNRGVTIASAILLINFSIVELKIAASEVEPSQLHLTEPMTEKQVTAEQIAPAQTMQLRRDQNDKTLSVDKQFLDDEANCNY